MDYKQAATTLAEMLKKHQLSSEEKEALDMALGVLSWAALSKNTIKKLKEKRDKSIE